LAKLRFNHRGAACGFGSRCDKGCAFPSRLRNDQPAPRGDELEFTSLAPLGEREEEFFVLVLYSWVTLRPVDHDLDSA
jgi:hypothetical protein